MFWLNINRRFCIGFLLGTFLTSCLFYSGSFAYLSGPCNFYRHEFCTLTYVSLLKNCVPFLVHFLFYFGPNLELFVPTVSTRWFSIFSMIPSISTASRDFHFTTSSTSSLFLLSLCTLVFLGLLLWLFPRNILSICSISCLPFLWNFQFCPSYLLLIHGLLQSGKIHV